MVPDLAEVFHGHDDVRAYAQVFTIRDGKLVRWRTYPDQQEALRAVGLAG